MRHPFLFVALAAERFAPLFAQTDRELAAIGARRMSVEEKSGTPCRVSLADAEVGETVLLVPFVHHDVDSPYRASGPIFVRRDAETARPVPGEVPAMFLHRLLSVRAYDAGAMMVDATVAPGTDLADVVGRLLANPDVHYLHVHNAAPGCFNCSVRRV